MRGDPVNALRPLALPLGVPTRAPVHPGRFLQKNFMTPLRLTQTETAQRLGISRRRLNEVIQGHRGLTPDTAIRFAMLFGGDTAFWLQLQSAFDCYHAWKAGLQSPERAPSFDEA